MCAHKKKAASTREASPKKMNTRKKPNKYVLLAKL